jgi:hypothetical protein
MPRNDLIKLIDRLLTNKKEYLYIEAAPSLGVFVSSTIPLCTHTGSLIGDFNTNKHSKARAFWMTPSKMLGETSANKRGNKKKPRVCRIRIHKSRVVKRRRPNAGWGTAADRGGNKMQDGQKKRREWD